jgi:hypothetical protein
MATVEEVGHCHGNRGHSNMGWWARGVPEGGDISSLAEIGITARILTVALPQFVEHGFVAQHAIAFESFDHDSSICEVLNLPTLTWDRNLNHDRFRACGTKPEEDPFARQARQKVQQLVHRRSPSIALAGSWENILTSSTDRRDRFLPFSGPKSTSTVLLGYEIVRRPKSE